MSEPNKEVVIRLNPWVAGILASIAATLTVAAIAGIVTTRDLARSTDQLARSNQAVINAYATDLNQMKARVSQVESRLSVVEDRTGRARKQGTSLLMPNPAPRPIPANNHTDPVANSRKHIVSTAWVSP